jgi:D-sedoheptulose 7-phosphate isomerase
VALGETIPAAPLVARVEELLERRTQANRAFFEAEAERLARCCHAMAERFVTGGRLVALGAGPAARSDARHVAVEFVHPVIVGKRALPAIGLAPEGGALGPQIEALADADDIVIGFGLDERDGGQTAQALALARARGCLTIAFAALGAEWEFVPPGGDPFVRQELIETLYHVLWELVHVFFEHRGILAGDSAEPADSGPSGFLYPFLSGGEHNLERVIDDVRASVLIKATEVGELRAQTLGENVAALIAAAAEMRRAFGAGGKLLAFGNGGSATDAMDLVADLRYPPPERGWAARAAIDLTEDPSILTAIANDIGPAEIFQRQVIAYGRDGDVAIAFSTSGGSENLIEALAESRRRGLATIALCGYDGGRIAAEGLADHVIVSRSQHIPRIQEAQASAYHVLRELVELAGDAAP